ncbi:MAG: salicylate synthase [Neisseriaceae bacterium]|nr:MAG: salicylate synthase [Neisseriaceae bacterium]
MTMKIDSKQIPYILSFLADKYTDNDYFAYESPQESFFALGNKKMIKLYSDRVELFVDGNIHSIEGRFAKPSIELNYYTKNFLGSEERIFVGVTFEFSIEELSVFEELEKNILLAFLFIPNVEIKITTENISSMGDAELVSEINDEIKKEMRKFDDNNLKSEFYNHVYYRTDDSYKERVKIAVTEILDKKYDKVILSRKISVPFEIDFSKSYLNGRLANNPARSFILNCVGIQSFGFSPELVARIEPDGRVMTEPLAGTRTLKNNFKENDELKNELYTDIKEVFEHAISVKVACDEISRISNNGKANITEFMVVKERGTVQHMASSVEGWMEKELSVFSVLASLFPSVTASGLPKKYAIEAINRLDDMPRGLYSGGVGYFDPKGVFDITLVLRSILKVGEDTFLRVGAGIVSDSNPEREYEETCEKVSSIAPYLVKNR